MPGLRLRGGVAALLWICCALLPAAARACLWDRDTLAMEGKGLPDTVNVLIGRFERQPPAYFEMRLARVAGLIADGKGALTDYDDAGVAADRLKRGEEAMRWMRQKKAQLDRLRGDDPARKEHLYRYHANLGTFHAHHWLRQGASRERLDDLKASREHLARAIELNPDAHFGRERYQLMAIDWLLELPALEDSAHPATRTLFWAARDKLGNSYRNQLQAAGFGDAAKGLGGLIVLGDAWESIDVFLALAYALEDQGHAGLAYLAQLRLRELLAQGRRSLHPELAGDKLEELLKRVGGQMHERTRESADYFAQARKAAEAWQAHRTAFMMERLGAGRHPDTDPAFWQGYQPLPGVELPDLSIRDKITDPGVLIVLLSAAVVLAIAVQLWRRSRAGRSRPG